MFDTSVRRPWRGLAVTTLACASMVLAGCSAGTPSAGADPRAASQGFIASATGACSDPWINSAYNEAFRRAPYGSGNTGECNIGLYGGGSWSSYQNLYDKVRMSKVCADPWVGQAVYEATGRAPNGAGNVGECDIHLYGGSWSGYADLRSKAGRAISTLRATNLTFSPSGDLLRLSTGAQVAPASPANIAINQNGAAIVAAGGGNFAVIPGIVAAGGGN